MTTKMKTKSALPWFGSDASVAADLAAMINDRKHVTIPFAGGMSILPHLTATHVVANDLCMLAYNFYRIASHSTISNHLAMACQKTMSHPMELEHAQEMCANFEFVKSYYDVPAAVAFWRMCWIGRKGKGVTKSQGSLPSVRRTPSGGSNASRLRSAACDLEAWAEEFRRCEFTCEDFRDCLSKVADDERCAIYVGAPWFGAGDGCLHSFSYEDHMHLHQALTKFKKTKVLVRYGDHETVRHFYGRGDWWNIHEATSRTQANKKIGELWITNLDVSL